MSYPKFFDTVESIKVEDKLSGILGSIDNGKYEFTYLEIVKAAGHSCPTVAGGYLMALEGLKVLYPDTNVIRGDVKVSFQDELEDGVAGVIANVFTHITGATQKSGFKGLNGKFARHSLMDFGADIEANVRLTRVDTGVSVDVTYDPSSIAGNPDMKLLMQKMMQNSATQDELKEFGALWQDRVKRIFENINDTITLVKR